MKERLTKIVAAAPAGVDPVNLVREYLQAGILIGLQRAGAMSAIAFHGGTALRFLYSLARYSEDLDFALERPEAGYDLSAALAAIETRFTREGYEIRTKLNERGVVHKASVSFPGLLYDVGISPHADQNIFIRIEVDTRPPAGATLQTSVVRRFETLRLFHHDLPSLFAGKLAAVMCRTYTKGRDFFDLLWYLSEHPGLEPNGELLASAVGHAGCDASLGAGWRAGLAERFETVDWVAVRRDVSPFLEDPAEADLLDSRTFEQLLA